MVGAGEYTCGFVRTVHGAASDKPAGVVALTCFDLRNRGLVKRMVVCDRTGLNFPEIRQTIQRKIGDMYKGLDLTLETIPADNVETNETAYLEAMDTMQRGSVVIIFTPDDTHFEITMAAIQRGLHVLVAKPAVKTLAHHRQIIAAAKEANVMVAVEFHKRFDPIYSDARNRIRLLGGFSYFYSWMSQPKQQLDTFRRWAGISSDISYYLNSHHIDVHAWSVAEFARPIRVTASGATGIASTRLGRECEDTITLLTQWENVADGSQGTAIYTASWVSAKGECHTQQHFHYMGHKGEVKADQAHRGYSCTTDDGGYAALNPLYMRYVPDAHGHFAGQTGYGYISIARFIEAAQGLASGICTLEKLAAEGQLALVAGTAPVTAILEAGRISLDLGGAPVTISYDEEGLPSALIPVSTLL